MTTLQDRRRRAHLALAAVVFSVGSVGAVLYRFPPERYGFYPRCPVYALTGWECPGCGMTRALAALMHGNVAESLRWNPMVLVVLAGLVVWGGVAYWRQVTGGEWPRVSDSAVAGMLVVAGVFMVVRNLVR